MQVHLSNGLPAMAIVGLADKAVGKSRERVRAALSSLGLALPAKRIAVNLSPADIVKEGAHFDLPNALGLLVAMGPCRKTLLMNTLFRENHRLMAVFSLFEVFFPQHYEQLLAHSG